MWGATLLLRSRESKPGSDGAAPQEIGKLWQRLLPHAERLITDFSEWDDDGITRKQFVLTVPKIVGAVFVRALAGRAQFGLVWAP